MKNLFAKVALMGVLAAGFAGAVSASAAPVQNCTTCCASVKCCADCANCCKDGQCKMAGKCCG